MSVNNNVHSDVCVPVASPLRTQRMDNFGRAYATGKRKAAIARVWLKPGNGSIIVNKQGAGEFFKIPRLLSELELPFKITGTVGHFDVVATTIGGGVAGQAGALRLGISRALTVYSPSCRPALKKAKLLTRDSRVVERKKYGHKKARKSFQYSKR